MKKIAFVLFFLLLLGVSSSITTCQAITGSNQYIALENDLNGNGGDCLVVDAENTTIDCNGYAITNALNGILITKNSKNITITSCRITGSTTGIFVDNVKTSNASQDGGMAYRAISATIENVNITSTTYGIKVRADSGTRIRFAYISAINTSIQLLDSDSILIENSTVKDADVGIHIKNSVREDPSGNSVAPGRNIIRNNFILNNNFGIRITGSKENLIYNNYFNNTVRNAETNSLVYGYINYWNSSYDCSSPSIINGRCKGGNFWGDYTGYDDGSSGTYPYNTSLDGVGDTNIPYMIMGEPLMQYNDQLPLTKKVPDTWVTGCKEITQSNTLYHVKQNIYGVISDTKHICLHVRASNVIINCYGNRIEDNTSYTDSVGVYISAYSNLTLINCTIMNYSIGLYENDSAYGTLYGNNFSNDQYDIFLNVRKDSETTPPPSLAHFSKNISTNNYVHGKKVYYYNGPVTGDGYPLPPASDAGMIAVVNHKNFILSGPYSPSWTYPNIILVNVSNGSVSGFTLYNYSLGVFILNSSNLSIKNNAFAFLVDAPSDSFSGGLGGYYLSNVSIERNNVTSCSVPIVGCFRILYSTNATFSANSFYNSSGTAIGLYRPTNPMIYDNNLTNISSGLYLYYTKWGKIFNNRMYITADVAPYSGIFSYSANGTEIYSNIFMKMPSPGGFTEAISSVSTFVSEMNTLKIYNNKIDTVPGATRWATGIYLEEHYNTSVYNNTICNINSTYYPYSGAISLYRDVFNSSIYNNTICNATIGINSHGGAGFIFDNKIYDNRIMNDPPVFMETAISMHFTSGGNLIYNNLLNATTLDIMTFVRDDSSQGTNMWNSSRDCSSPNILGGQCKGGNYYPLILAGYVCDGDGDGIGEQTVPISGTAGAIDYLPITQMRCKNFVKIENKTVVLPEKIVVRKKR